MVRAMQLSTARFLSIELYTKVMMTRPLGPIREEEVTMNATRTENPWTATEIYSPVEADGEATALFNQRRPPFCWPSRRPLSGYRKRVASSNRASITLIHV